MPELEDPKKVSNNDLRNAQFGGGFINAENVNAQRIGGDIWNFFLGQQLAPVGNPQREHNQRLLLADVKQEVTARLRQSLHNAVLINLGKEPQPQQVKRPWDAEIKIGLKPAEPLPNSTTILQVFDSEEIAGKLLILGNPGSGKTTTQLELAQALVSRAEEQPDYPIPVLFNLSSWKDDRQSITDWLVAELKSKYGVSTKLGQEWVDNQQLLPLLDGLDELESQRQEICVQTINQFLTSENRLLYLVVCSRSEEYSNYSTQLQLNGAIFLQSLSNNQIFDYLTSINYLELWTTISSDLDLLELVKTPLLLSITVLASQEISVEELQNLTSTVERFQYLLDTYIERMLTRHFSSRAYLNNKIPNAKKTQIWLVWLAQKMQRESKTEFLIEEIQPSWVESISYDKYRWFVSIVFILISLPILKLFLLFIDEITGGIIIELNDNTLNWLIIIMLILYSYIKLNVTMIEKIKIETVEKLSFSREAIKFLFVFISTYLAATLPVSILIAWLNNDLNIKNVILYQFIGSGSSWILQKKLFELLTDTLTSSKIEKKTLANQGIWNSALNAVIFVLFGVVFGYIYGWLYSWARGGSIIGVITFVGVFTSWIFAFTGGMTFGGQACIQHFTLRLILYFNGYIPWNYARFLDYCTERLFLQRVGGRYRFIHKLLQDHFAQMEFKRNVD